MTDKEIADFVGVAKRTLGNWKKGQNVGDIIFYPPVGKHNLYKGAKLATYLLSYPTFKNEDGEEESENFNEIEILKSNVDVLAELIKHCKCPENSFDVEGITKNIKKIIDELEEVSNV